MKRPLSIVLALCMLLSCAVFFSGCSSDNGDFPVTFGDVTIEQEPQAIVVLNDDLADIISYIGYDIKMVGRSEECDQEFLHVVPTMGPGAAPDTAAVISAGADLVIADSTLSADAKSALNSAKINVVTMDPATTEEGLKELYINLGTVLGGNTTGQKKGEKGYDELFEMLDTLNTASTDFVTTAAYLYVDGQGQLCTFVKGTLEYKFFNYNGCSNVFANQETPVVDTAQLRIGSPNYIFYDSQAVLDAISADESLSNLDAMVNGRTCLIEKKNFMRHGTTAEETVFEMLSYIEKDNKASDDEATPDYLATTASSAPAPADDAAAAPAASAENEPVITFEDTAAAE